MENQVERRAQKGITAGLRDSLDKMKKEKSELEKKLKTKSDVNSPTLPSYVALYPQLPVPDYPEDRSGERLAGNCFPKVLPALGL